MRDGPASGRRDKRERMPTESSAQTRSDDISKLDATSLVCSSPARWRCGVVQGHCGYVSKICCTFTALPRSPAYRTHRGGFIDRFVPSMYFGVAMETRELLQKYMHVFVRWKNEKLDSNGDLKSLPRLETHNGHRESSKPITRPSRSSRQQLATHIQMKFNSPF